MACPQFPTPRHLVSRGRDFHEGVDSFTEMAAGATMNSIRFDNPVAEAPGDMGDTFDIEADEKGMTFDVDDCAVDPKERTAAADPAASRSGMSSSRRLSLTNEFLSGDDVGSTISASEDLSIVFYVLVALLSRVTLSIVLSHTFAEPRSNSTLVAFSAELGLALAASCAVFMDSGIEGFHEPFNGSYGTKRVQQYALMGIFDGLGWVFLGSAYKHITPLEVQVITLLSTPGSAFLFSVVLHRGVPLVEKLSYFIVTALSIALVLHHHNETVNTTDEGTSSTAGFAEVDWNLGVGLAFASTVCTSFLILHQEIGATADRTIAEVLFFKSIAGVLVLGPAYVGFTLTTEDKACKLISALQQYFSAAVAATCTPFTQWMLCLRDIRRHLASHQLSDPDACENDGLGRHLHSGFAAEHWIETNQHRVCCHSRVHWTDCKASEHTGPGRSLPHRDSPGYDRST